MPRPRWKQIVRQFPENGLKLLLEDPANVRDLLGLAAAEVAERIDFANMRRVKATFVGRDFRHVEADVVLTAPLRRRGGRTAERVWIYVLIEHQSEPDALMELRVLDYVVQVYKAQLREWTREHASFAGVRLGPVLPVVFYTGTKRWESIGKLTDLIAQGEEFARWSPRLNPIFLNLDAVSPERLATDGGFLGWVLRLLQQRDARPASFQELLRQAVERLEGMPPADRLRWLELVSYVHALVYHMRSSAEVAYLQEVIEGSVRTDPYRSEVNVMKRTFADELMDKGREEGKKLGRAEEAVRARRETLLRLLRRKFDVVPAKVQHRIDRTSDVAVLDRLLEDLMDAKSLEDLGIR